MAEAKLAPNLPDWMVEHAATRKRPRAGRLGDGFFPSIGAQVDTMPLIDVVRDRPSRPAAIRPRWN